jgi:hypothetical protein
MYGYEYWIKKGYSEEDAIERSKGNVRCFICSNFFPKNQSMSSGKHICSELCNQVKKENALAAMRKSKQVYVKCIVCDSDMRKKNSLLTYKNICTEKCLSEYKSTLNYGSPYRIENYLKKGYTEDEARQIISEAQKGNSPRCIEYWIKKGFDEEQAELEVSKFQTLVNSRRNHSRDTKVFCEEYWIKHGYSDSEAKELAYNAANTTSKHSFIKKYGHNEGIARYEEYCRNISYYVSKEYFELKYGIQEGRKRYFRKFKRSNGSKVSKISSYFFTELHKVLPDTSLTVYYEPFTKEFLLIDGGSVYFYDFVIKELGLIIEFNGSYWHGDPYTYSESDIVAGRAASDVWASDYKKCISAYNRGYQVVYVWYLTNRSYRLNGKIYKKRNDVIVELLSIIGEYYENYKNKKCNKK